MVGSVDGSNRDDTEPGGRRRSAWFVAKVMITFLSVVGIAGSGAHLTNGLDSLPAWLTAVATTAALLSALLAARYAANAWRLEEVREARRDLREQRAQAQLVAAWVGELPTIVKYGRREAMPSEYFVRNASDVPVTNARIVFTLRVLDGTGSTYVDAFIGFVNRMVN